jgi:hypothetical protein
MFVGFMVVSVGWLTFVQKSRSSDLADIFEES